jgi:5-methylcytosine-specific restriction endonuclease McrA
VADEIISRDEAKVKGLKHYFTGLPCKNGHISKRRVVGWICLECDAIGKAASRNMDAEGAKRKARIYYEKNLNRNREVGREASRIWRQKNPGAERIWRLDNKEKLNQKRRLRYAKNPARQLIHFHNRRARQLTSGGTHTPADLSAIFKAQNGKCAYCRVSLSKRKKHVDHILPLSCGGSNDRTNIQYLCAPCNLTKGAKDPILFAQELGRLL